MHMLGEITHVVFICTAMILFLRSPVLYLGVTREYVDVPHSTPTPVRAQTQYSLGGRKRKWRDCTYYKPWAFHS